MKTTHRIIIGDSRMMNEIGNESVHLIITSPPYWQLKDYGSGNQIGFNDNYENYINHLNLVWNECYRVLHPGCRFCINIGDQFARSVYYGRYKIIPIRTEIIKFCETIGFDYMGAIIWQKVTTCNTTGGASIMGSFPYPRNGIVKLDYEFILLFKKNGKSPVMDRKIKEESKLSKEEWNQYFSGHWYFPGEKQDRHLAMFPEELPKRLIKMFSFVGDTILDPFLGSGTTSSAAKKLKRNSIGFEINEEFIPIIQEKMKEDQKSFFHDLEIQVVRQDIGKIDYNEKINKLPYIFKDPVKFDKKVDPKKLNFGSKIDNSDTRKDELYSVKKVHSPELVELDSGMKIRLIGIKEIKKTREEAVSFLLERTKRQKVFLRFDEIKYDHENNLMGYLYLTNHTFLNAHLIKKGLADVNLEIDFKYKSSFLKKKNEGTWHKNGY